MGAVHIFGQRPRKNGLTKKPIIKGDFSSYKIDHKELSLFKLNKFMAFCLLAFAVFSMISYIAVIFREAVIKDIHTKTAGIFYENIDLQNKVDNLKSFYSIDNKVSKINFLQKADKVIEVKDINKPVKIKNIRDKHNLKQLPAGF
jgi:hypothetical protein